MEEDNEKLLNRFKNNPPSASYIAGFIDGDGCIFIRKIKDGYQSGFTITQCRTNILQILRYHFGGSITSSTNRNDKIKDTMNDENNFYYKYNVRNQYNLLIRNNEYQILLYYLKDSFIIKEKQYQSLYEFNKLSNLTNKNQEKEDLFVTCSLYNKYLDLNEIYLSRLNNEYISGLFDAEGCIYIDKELSKFRISISQKNHPKILDEISKFLNMGKVMKYVFILYKKEECLKFIQLIKNNIIVKYNQAIAFETFLQTESAVVKEEMYKICNEEKHKIEYFTDLNQSDKGKHGFFETLKLRAIKVSICKEINLKQVYKEKSEKMKGEGNHNYGKQFSEETKRKMSESIRDAKGSVSDEIIQEVRKFINEKKTNIEIQKLLNLPRHTVTRIKNGHVICRFEKKEDKKTMSQEETNISKRKVTTQEILFIIDKIIEDWKPMKILDYLFEEREKNNKENNLTIDIIKNIKRNVSANKIPIYKSEVDNDTYNKYFNIILEYNNKNKIIK